MIGKPNLNYDTVEALMTRDGIGSYAELARRSNLDRTYVSRVMRRERPPQAGIVFAFAKVFGVPPVALLGPSDPAAAVADLDAQLEEAS